MTGGDSRLYLNSNAMLVNNAGATLTISGNTLIGRPAPVGTGSHLLNRGTMVVNGPATLNMPMGNGMFQQYGDLTVNNATIYCSIAAANPDTCAYQDNNGGSIPTGSITRLNNATLDIGGPGKNYNFFKGSTITGNGTINIDMSAYGTLAPCALLIWFAWLRRKRNSRLGMAMMLAPEELLVRGPHGAVTTTACRPARRGRETGGRRLRTPEPAPGAWHNPHSVPACR